MADEARKATLQEKRTRLLGKLEGLDRKVQDTRTRIAQIEAEIKTLDAQPAEAPSA